MVSLWVQVRNVAVGAIVARGTSRAGAHCRLIIFLNSYYFPVTEKCGGRSRARTADLLLVSELEVVPSGSSEFKRILPDESSPKYNRQRVMSTLGTGLFGCPIC